MFSKASELTGMNLLFALVVPLDFAKYLIVELQHEHYNRDAPLADTTIQFLEKNEDNFNFGAIAKQLNNILSKVNAPKIIDFLSLDVEGSEIEVLKGINHNEYRFKFICIESRDIQKINNYLTINNYLLIEQLSPIDYLFKDKELN